jgi:hypothetical protein
VKSRLTRRFRRAFAELPDDVKERARDTYRIFRDDPNHPSLRFKGVHPTDPIYSVRIGLGYRAIGVPEGDTIYWYWIGGHGEYERLISQGM